MARKVFTSIPVEQPQMKQLQAIKELLQGQAGRTLRWTDVLTVLLKYRDQLLAMPFNRDSNPFADLGPEHDRDLTAGELAAMKAGDVGGVTVTLSEEDTERIVERVVEKLGIVLPQIVEQALNREANR